MNVPVKYKGRVYLKDIDGNTVGAKQALVSYLVGYSVVFALFLTFGYVILALTGGNR